MAVYPAHGVGVIESIVNQHVAGQDQDFYVLKILDNNMTIMIPTVSSDNVGLRAIIKKNEVKEVISILEQRDVEIVSQTWNRRYREYMDKIKTGSLFEVAEVFRDLFHLKMTKDLSFGERKLYDTAQVLLVRELSTAKNTDEKTIMTEIEGHCQPPIQ